MPACVQSARAWRCRSCVRVDSSHNVRHVSEVDTGVHFEARAESVGEISSRGGVFYSVFRKTNSPPRSGDLIYCEAFVGENICIHLKILISKCVFPCTEEHERISGNLFTST